MNTSGKNVVKFDLTKGCKPHDTGQATTTPTPAAPADGDVQPANNRNTVSKRRSKMELENITAENTNAENCNENIGPDEAGLCPRVKEYVQKTVKWLNEALAGKTVHSVEPGYTAGWMVINFTPPDADPRIYLTVWLGGTRPLPHPSERQYHWDIGLLTKNLDGFGHGGSVYRSFAPGGLKPDRTS